MEIEHILRDFGLHRRAGGLSRVRRRVPCGIARWRSPGLDGPAILIPLFDRLRLRPKVSQTVVAEIAFNDVTGTVLTLTLVGAVEAGGFTFSGPALEFAKELALGAILAVVASLLLARGVEGAQIAVSMAALAVCVTLLLQATTAGYVAHRLGLLDS